MEAEASPVVHATVDGDGYKSKVLPVPHQIENLIREMFPECPDTMIAIAKAESKLKADAVNVNRNGTKDCGIFQINEIHGYDCEWLKIPENNLKAGRAVYDKQGLTAWVTYNYAKKHNLPI